MKEYKKTVSRRNFTKLTGTAMGAIPFLGFPAFANTSPRKQPEDLHISLFSKHLQFLDYNAMASATASMGFNGLDLTVRPKGHVLPEKVTTDLSKAVAAMEAFGIAPKMMTTNVWKANDPQQKTVLATASALGFTHYRTGWLDYPETETIANSLKGYSQEAKDLAQLNETLGLTGCYQNHAGKHVGAPIWDIPQLLSQTRPEHLGCQYDIRHAVVEGGSSWELGLRLVAPFIRSIVIKDFKWGLVNGVWKPVSTPLGEGMVPFDRYFSLLKTYGINVPVSLHLEYPLGGAEHGATALEIPAEKVFEQMRSDLEFIRTTWKNA